MHFTTLVASTAIALASTALAAPSQLIPRTNSLSLQKRGAVIDYWPRAANFTAWVGIGCYSMEAKLVYDTGMCQCQNAAWKAGAGEIPFSMEKCFSYCKGAGFRYAGIKGDPGAKHCWCGSGISDDDKLSSDAKCDKPCESNEALQVANPKAKYDHKQCGGSKTWSVWKDPCYAKFDPDEAASGYTYVGCFWYQGYILGDWSLPISDNLSIEDCLQTCAGWGYAYAGMTLGWTCQCGGKIPKQWIDRHGITPSDNAGCTSLCTATAKIKASITPAEYQYCGASWFMSIWKNPDLDVQEKSRPRRPRRPRGDR
ncbi:hypothetical protein ABW20_dc0108370 [Dactylellina cionopaga]|nr:hypothetical protein ABW20_dc0108370 [Dactylellina cionopaga]